MIRSTRSFLEYQNILRFNIEVYDVKLAVKKFQCLHDINKLFYQYTISRVFPESLRVL